MNGLKNDMHQRELTLIRELSISAFCSDEVLSSSSFFIARFSVRVAGAVAQD